MGQMSRSNIKVARKCEISILTGDDTLQFESRIINASMYIQHDCHVHNNNVNDWYEIHYYFVLLKYRKSTIPLSEMYSPCPR